MAEFSRRKIPTRRRTASRASQPSTAPRTTSIEGWISDEERRSEFITLWKDKPLITPKFIQSQWFVNRHFTIQNFLAEQGVKFFTEMQGTYYPDLVRAFYFNYKFKDGVGFTKVKGVDIILDDDIWENVAQFPIHDGTSPIFTADIEGFNRIFAYRSFMRRPDQEIGRQLLAGPLKIDERLLHYLIVWILCPRGTNHAQCSEADLMIIYAMLNHIPIYWPSIILDTMLKAKRLPQYPLSYYLLISRICEYKGVNVSNEQSHKTTTTNKIAENSLKQMKFIPFGNTYIHKDDMPPSDNEEEENPPTAPIPPVDTNIGSSSGVGGSSSSLKDHILNLNQRFEEFFLLSTHRHEEVIGLIRGLDSRISNIEHKFDKYEEDDDMSQDF